MTPPNPRKEVDDSTKCTHSFLMEPKFFYLSYLLALISLVSNNDSKHENIFHIFDKTVNKNMGLSECKYYKLIHKKCSTNISNVTIRLSYHSFIFNGFIYLTVLFLDD